MKTEIYEIKKKKDIVYSVQKITEKKAIKVFSLETLFRDKSQLTDSKFLFFLIVNGLSSQLIDFYLKKLNPINFAISLNLKDTEFSSSIDQLCWLKNQSKIKKAVLLNKLETAMIAIILKFEYLICYDMKGEDLIKIEEFADADNKINERALTLDQIDSYENSMLSIVAKKDLRKNKLLTKQDLAFLNVKPNGVAPHLIEKILGLRLKYPIKKNTRITFGDIV
ncbi:MAG: hypothetical protein CBB97_13785 [Candidatus Endolissoclinum sp. TMED37]|nr:MAG: hypothetical protein CBB97_13785 [Candidatus Endolissoclinum sp. TMED37]|tara:strand:- start:1756 stop:2424 length:669 start_codon:yes stop_codon:yes gene_type:complete